LPIDYLEGLSHWCYLQSLLIHLWI
jgi:hypothetical protein